MLTTLKSFLFYVRLYKKYLFVSILSLTVNVFCSLIVPIIIGQSIDLIVGRENVSFDRVSVKIFYIFVITLVGACLQWLASFYVNKMSYKCVNHIRNDVFSKINSIPLKVIDQSSHGDLLSRITNDTDAISEGMIQFITQFFTGVLTITGTIFFMLSIDIWISVVVILITPLSLLFASFVSKKSHHFFKAQSEIQGELNGYIEEMIGGQKVIKSFAFEDRSKEGFERINSKLYTYGFKSQFYSAITNPGTRFINTIIYVIVGVVGALTSIINKRISIGEISCLLSYANQYTKPFNEITSVMPQIQTALASMERVFSVLEKEDELGGQEICVPKEKVSGSVSFENVSFSYKKGHTFIKNFSMNVKPGEHVAIVGPTGCGKTTVINLLMRFYDIDLGQIKINNISILNMSRSGVRSLFGMVLQETWLFSGTVRENIAYGKPNATDDEIVTAAKRSYAHNFIVKLENGYQTMISEDGNNLSQGQRQLLCIARVMLIDPPMLILDEATSNIDTRTELKVQRAFQNLMRGRTSFIIAHRLSTIKSADKIIVMKDGRIIENGRHECLLSNGGFYKSLHDSQFSTNC